MIRHDNIKPFLISIINKIQILNHNMYHRFIFLFCFSLIPAAPTCVLDPTGLDLIETSPIKLNEGESKVFNCKWDRYWMYVRCSNRRIERTYCEYVNSILYFNLFYYFQVFYNRHDIQYVHFNKMALKKLKQSQLIKLQSKINVSVHLTLGMINYVFFTDIW